MTCVKRGMIGTGTWLSITSTPAASGRSLGLHLNQAPLRLWRRLQERNRCKIIFGGPARPSPFSHYTGGKKSKKKKKQQQQPRRPGPETQPLSLLSHNWVSVYVQPITLSRLPQTDDVSNWKAWNTLERPASHRTQPYFYLPRLAPKWREGALGGEWGWVVGWGVWGGGKG